MIKVPAAPEGFPAVEELIAQGLNVNVTLMFSLEQYEAAARAHNRGLARLADPTRAASVSSFFVSRVDTKVDALLDEIGTDAALALRGRAAVANARQAYQLSSEARRGAGVHRRRRRVARGHSDCCGPAPAQRIPTTPRRCTWTILWGQTRSIRCRRRLLIRSAP